MKIVLLGSHGQLGHELQRALSPLGSISCHGKTDCDVTDTPRLGNLIAAASPQVIVNATAYTAVDRAETDIATAYSVNHHAVSTLAELAKQHDALLVHYSTDYVFDGIKPAPYVESDSVNPLSVYGKSKAAGEQAVIDSGCEHLIFRTSWVFSARGSNFINTMLQLGRQRDHLRVVADQWGAPTSAELIADVTAHAIEDVLACCAPGGLYHLAAGGKTSWHGYASYIFAEAARRGAGGMRGTSLEPIATAEHPFSAARPANSRLDTTKLQQTFSLVLPHWHYHVRRTLDHLLGNY